jgi:hypothetical protein
MNRCPTPESKTASVTCRFGLGPAAQGLGLQDIQRSLFGIAAFLVEATPRFEGNFRGVGLPDLAVKESCERIRSALGNCGFNFLSSQAVTVNLAPADARKEGSAFDLPKALGPFRPGNLHRQDSRLLKRKRTRKETRLELPMWPACRFRERTPYRSSRFGPVIPRVQSRTATANFKAS